MHEDIQWFLGFLLVVAVIAYGGWNARKNAPPPTSPPVTQTVTQSTQTRGTHASGISEQDRLREQIRQAEQEVAKLQEEVVKAEAEAKFSPLKGRLFIQAVQPGYGGTQEYLIIANQSQNNVPIVITGLQVQGVQSRLNVRIPQAWLLLFPDTSGEGEPVTLKPGERAYLITGRSANGKSFQLNKCAGYFEQGLNFAPPLPISCPRPINDPLPEPPNHLSENCLEYLQTIPACTTHSGSFPPNLQNDGGCQRYIQTHTSYDRCVSLHKNDSDFYSGEWRLYLGRDENLWSLRHDTIELKDRDGKLIHSYSY